MKWYYKFEEIVFLWNFLNFPGTFLSQQVFVKCHPPSQTGHAHLSLHSCLFFLPLIATSCTVSIKPRPHLFSKSFFIHSFLPFSLLSSLSQLSSSWFFSSWFLNNSFFFPLLDWKHCEYTDHISWQHLTVKFNTTFQEACAMTELYPNYQLQRY